MPLLPTNVLTGFLGVGKTTAILDLLHSSSERWAVLVNEFGEVSIDQAILEGGTTNVAVREVGGGCICCTTAPYLQVALHLLLTEAKPTRLLVETTGLGHPGRLLDALRTQYSDRLDVRATITLVAPDDTTNASVLANPIFREQVDLADVLLLNKLDRAKPGDVEAFQKWASELFPPKALIAATQHGRLEPAWLDLCSGNNLPMKIDLQPTSITPIEVPQPMRNQPVRMVSPGSAACGWIFSPDDMFDEDRLLVFLNRITSPRLKGVFRVANDRVVINRSAGATTVTPTHYRQDSRVEIFGDLDWDAIELGLMKCLVIR